MPLRLFIYLDEWKELWREEAREEGLEEGREEGHAEGLVEGERKIVDLLKSGKTPEDIIRMYG